LSADWCMLAWLNLNGNKVHYTGCSDFCLPNLWSLVSWLMRSHLAELRRK
jgi:hypothetical protein